MSGRSKAVVALKVGIIDFPINHPLISNKSSNTKTKNKQTKKNSPGWCVAQWTEGQPVNQRVTSSIPSQGTCVGCGPGSQ